MKLRSKIIVVFILSIIMSVTIFLITIVYLMSDGWWAGITTEDINYVVENVASEILAGDTFSKEMVEPILIKWKDKYSGMELELLSEQSDLICDTSSGQQINSINELILDLSRNGQFSQNRWISARGIELVQGKKGYIVAVIPAKYFTAISINYNGIKGAGIWGKMFLFGLGITLIISCFCAYLFTMGMSKRFSLLYKGISSFQLGNLDFEMHDDSKDEIGHLTTTFKAMAERIKKQIDEEKEYQEEKKKLVSNISHDLRTPLTSVIGYSESLENCVYEGEEERSKFISIIRKKAIYMDKLLGELLEFSKLDSGKYKLKRQKTDISEFSREILIEYIPALEDNNIELIVEIPEQVQTINIDKDKISRVIRNLMDNAIKYGADGKVIEFLIADEHDFICIKVKDYGLGIDSQNLQAIFKRFYRGDKGRVTKDGGMGLGLAIADEIIKLHGGKINVESNLGKGTLFTVSLPKMTLV